jgi:hypothetical protein
MEFISGFFVGIFLTLAIEAAGVYFIIIRDRRDEQ